MSFARYYKRKRIELNCQIITPMFLGNAQQEAEWRAAPFKSLLRYWWRVTQHSQSDHKQLLKKEGELFGYAGDSDSNKSLVQIILPALEIKSSREDMPRIGNINHPEVERAGGNINPLRYLAGMGLLSPNGSVKHSYFDPGGNFQLVLEYPQKEEEDIGKTLALIQAFGAIGGRCRNGWGSFQITNPPVNEQDADKYLLVFMIDYPNCLGSDDHGKFLWRTNPRPTWQEAMKQLAEIYIQIRAQNFGPGLEKLNPGEKQNPTRRNEPKQPGERHLLGIPLTNHPGNWGGSARHASPLRFIVKRKSEGFIGFVLHLPHRHSEAMSFPGNLNEKAGQIKVWEKVHRKLDHLDHLLQRATYGECL
jgi:CRISPR-associated protein Cmr1